SENNGNNNTNEGNDNGLPSHLKKVQKSLNRRQKENYGRLNTLDTKIIYLEGIDEERRKSEIGIELIGLVLYTLITVIIVIIYALFFKEEKSTMYFVVLMNTIYYIAKIIILGTNMERVGLTYNNKVRFYTVIPIIMWTSLAILLGIFVISPAVTITFANIGIE
ncbi:23978_t:CDS:2, partial [Gigaspora margarita]